MPDDDSLNGATPAEPIERVFDKAQAFYREVHGQEEHPSVVHYPRPPDRYS